MSSSLSGHNDPGACFILSFIVPAAQPELTDFIEDSDAVSPHEATIKDNLRQNLNKVLGTLTPREERVLRMRFGIDNEVDLTLEEVGKNFSVTRERIRQIEAKALKKLKHPNRKKQLESFVMDD